MTTKSRKWKQETLTLLYNHIASDQDRKLRFPGGTLIPGGPGESWRVMFGGMIAELSDATEAMLSRAIVKKTNRLKDWKRGFEQSWLLLLNCYPLAFDETEMQRIFAWFRAKQDGVDGFDGIFWSDYPDRALVPVYLTQEKPPFARSRP